MATVETVNTTADAADLDELLWRILWQPLGFPRDVRSKFTTDGEKLEVAAKKNGEIVGGLVAVWTTGKEIELRHLAVASNAQGKGVGRRLVTELSRIATSKKCYRIYTIARKTSVGFFHELGFRSAPGQAPEHPIFLKHGITFELMEKIVEQGDSPNV